MLRNTNIDFTLGVNKKLPLAMDVQLYSYDKNSHEFELTFLDTELKDNHEVKVLSVFEDSGTVSVAEASIRKGRVFFTFNTNLITRSESVVNYVYLKGDNSQTNVGAFRFNVRLSEIDNKSKVIAKAYDESYESLIQDFEKEIRDYLPKLETINQEESTRQDEEAVRKLAEADRVASESARKGAETERTESEEVRELAELERITNEEVREQAENERESKDSTRDNKVAIAEESAKIAQQAMADYLAMLGVDIATLGADGKLTADQIPPLAINDTFTVHSKEEITGLVAQRGDVAILIHDENVSDAYILAEDAPEVLDNWIKLGVSYVAKAGHAEAATNAVNSQKINGHRIVALSQEQYDLGAKDPNTVYLVGDL